MDMARKQRDRDYVNIVFISGTLLYLGKRKEAFLFPIIYFYLISRIDNVF